MAVVVLPTPPFWFATEIIRLVLSIRIHRLNFLPPALANDSLRPTALDPDDVQNDTVRIDLTGMFYQIEIPCVMG